MDLVIFGIVAWNMANGLRSGTVWATLDLAVLLLSVTVASALYARLAIWSYEAFGLPVYAGEPTAFGLVWVVAHGLLGAFGTIVAEPFAFITRGSALDRAVSLLPSAAKGLAVAGFLVALVLSPPAALLIHAPGVAVTLQDAFSQSQFAPPLARWVAGYGNLAQRLSEGRLPHAGNAAQVMGEVLPGRHAGATTMQPDPPPVMRTAPPVTPKTPPPVTGQGFPPEVYESLDLLDRSGNSWVRNTLNQWVMSVRFLPSDGAGRIRETVYFGRADPRPHDGVYYHEIVLADSQRSRGKFLAGWLTHEATHVLQMNTDRAAYDNCKVREPQAYMLQGYALLDLFGDLDAVRKAKGVYRDEIRYATAAKNNDMADLLEYSKGIYPDCRR
ncbi:MAG: CvpA family protein [Chloroflexi bacterium]|nr:CvpA family protein [Chloroflexota bacterium]